MLLFMSAALVAIRWSLAGSLMHAAGALGALWEFRGASPLVLYPFIVAPLVLMALAYGVGRPEPRRRAAALVLALPLLTFVAAGAWPASRMIGRLDDGDRSARRVTGNGVDLVWAPEGPGWPEDGVSWAEASRICHHLNERGTAVSDTPCNIWRLPTVEEAVRSQHYRGANCGGAWDAQKARATYRRMPDKESPLWDPHSQVIYWWTAVEKDADEAYIVVYNGQVWPRPKSARWGYLAFRAVRDAPR
jgi:hypothetical protein